MESIKILQISDIHWGNASSMVDSFKNLRDGMKGYLEQGKRIKLRCPPKVLTGTLHPSLPSIFSG